MKIFKCDRCGGAFDKNKDKWDEPLVFRVSWNYREIDLCDDCLEELQTWVTKYRKENAKE